MSRFVIKISSASMPSTCWGQYRHIGLLEMEDNAPPPAMISKRSRGCIRVVEEWRNLNVGKTARCAYRRALAEAEARKAELEGEK